MIGAGIAALECQRPPRSPEEGTVAAIFGLVPPVACGYLL